MRAIAAFTPVLGAPTMDNARREMETNYFGTLAMCRAFAPVLKRNGGGALVNILSVVSWFNAPVQGTYCASKAAEWSLTKAVQFELRAQGTLVVAVHAGYIDTGMTAGLTVREIHSRRYRRQGDCRHREQRRGSPGRRSRPLGPCRPVQGRGGARRQHAGRLGRLRRTGKPTTADSRHGAGTASASSAAVSALGD